MEKLYNEAHEKYEYKDGKLYFKYKTSNFIKMDRPVGTLHHCGWYTTRFNGKVAYSVHRIIFLMNHGYLPVQVDHINRIKTDNRIENLRAADNAQNMWNKGKVHRHGLEPKSIYKGITKTRSNKYMARICKYGERICLGTFDSEKEAALAYNKKALELHGEFARLNIIED